MKYGNQAGGLLESLRKGAGGGTAWGSSQRNEVGMPVIAEAEVRETRQDKNTTGTSLGLVIEDLGDRMTALDLAVGNNASGPLYCEYPRIRVREAKGK